MRIIRLRQLRVVVVALVAATSGVAETPPKIVLRGLAGLQTRLIIIKDEAGVPHIQAQNQADAWFGLGFVHAEDRLWQLEYLRRVGRGRLAEVLGALALPGDRLFRTLGLAQSAAETWSHYPAEHRASIRSYTAGINAAMNIQRSRGLPPEFGILAFEPETWQPEDVLVVAKVLGWSVDRNWNQEALRLQLVQKVGTERAAFLMPAYTEDGPVIVQDFPATTARHSAVGASAETASVDRETLARLHQFESAVAESIGFGGVGRE